MASGTMSIKYTDNDIRNRANDVARRLDDVCDHVDGIQKKLSSYVERGKDDYLADASAFLRKKSQAMRQKQNMVTAFATQVDTFMDQVEDADKHVADHIEDTYEQFKKITGISDGFWSTLVDFVSDFAKYAGAILLILGNPIGQTLLLIYAGIKVVQAIKEWYNNLPPDVKYILKIFVEIALIIVAIVAFPASSLLIVKICAGILIADKIVSLIKTSSALGAYRAGDAGIAARIDSLSSGEFFGVCMEQVTGISAKTWSTGYSVVTFVATVVTVADSVGRFISKASVRADGIFKGSSGITKSQALKQAYKTQFMRELPFGKRYDKLRAIVNFRKWSSASTLTKFTMDISDSLNWASEYVNFANNIIKPIFFDPLPGSFGEGIGTFADNIPLIDKGKSVVDKIHDFYKISKNIDNFYGVPSGTTSKV